jgi:hypothetical protein
VRYDQNHVTTERVALATVLLSDSLVLNRYEPIFHFPSTTLHMPIITVDKQWDFVGWKSRNHLIPVWCNYAFFRQVVGEMGVSEPISDERALEPAVAVVSDRRSDSLVEELSFG